MSLWEAARAYAGGVGAIILVALTFEALYWMGSRARMSIGTKSLLFGAHQILIHTCFVAWAWWRLFGFPWDPRLWLMFVVHDLGYLGKPNMDGPEGERHVELGARIMGWACGPRWAEECLCHSRAYAKRAGRSISRLGVADKYSIVLTPWWIYLPLVRLTGEWREYTEAARTGKYAGLNSDDRDGLRAWYASVQAYLVRWLEEQR